MYLPEVAVLRQTASWSCETRYHGQMGASPLFTAMSSSETLVTTPYLCTPKPGHKPRDPCPRCEDRGAFPRSLLFGISDFNLELIGSASGFRIYKLI